MDFSILGVSQENADMEIIEKINDNSIHYFIDIYLKVKDKQTLNEDANNYYKSYLLLYMSNCGISTMKYEDIFKELLNDNLLILKLIEDYIDSSDIDKIIVEYIDYSFQKYNDLDFLKIVLNLSKSTKICCAFMISKYSNIFEYCFNRYIALLKSKNKVNDSKLSIYNIIKNFLKVKTIRQQVLNWFYSVIDINQNLIKLEPLLDKYKKNEIFDYSRETYLVTITNILTELWLNGVTESRLKTIDYDYLNSNLCKFTNTNENNNDYNFMTQGLFMIYKFYMIGFYRLNEEHKLREDEEINFNRLIDNPQDTSQFDYASLLAIELNKRCKDRMAYIKDIFSNLDTKKNIKNVHNYTLKLLCLNSNIKNSEFTDNILSMLYSYFNDEVPFLDKNLNMCDNNILCLIHKIIKDSNVTNNPHIKCNYLELLVRNLEFIGSYNDNLKNIADSLPQLILFIKKSNANGEIYDSNRDQYNICSIINRIIFVHQSYYDCFFKKLESDQEQFKLMINIIIEAFQYCMNEALEKLKNISMLEKNYPLINEDKDNIELYKKNLKFYLPCSYEFLLTLCNFTKNYQNIFTCDEICDSFAHNIIYFLNKLLGNNRNDYKINNPEEIKFYPLDFLEIFRDILLNLNINKKFINAVANDQRSYNEKLINTLISILSKKNSITNYQITTLKLLNCDIKQVKINILEEENIEIPEELCDPIMSTLIEDPIVLPNTDIIMDKGIIMRHLLNDKHNPFNREDLTVEQLEEYNKSEDIILVLKEFKIKLKEFKRSTVLTSRI